MNILFIDTETTGQNPNRNTLVEIAARLDVDGKTVDKFETKLFNPKSVTHLGALKYNGLKLDDLTKMPVEIEGLMKFLDWLLTLQDKYKGTLYICGQNVGFDIRFIWAALSKYDIEGLDDIMGFKVLDTFGLALALHQVGKLQTKDNKLSLSDIAEGLGINLSGRNLHTAMADVDLVAEVLYKLLELMKK